MPNARTTKLASRLVQNAQPITRLENTSSTTPIYNQPSVVGRNVRSDNHF